MYERRIKFGLPLVGIRSEAEIAANVCTESTEQKQRKTQIELTRQAMAVLNSIRSTTETIKENQRAAHAELVESTVELAVLISENIVRRSIEREEFGVERLVTQIVARCATDEPVVIRLHPQDKELLERSDLEQDTLEQIGIVADASLRRGTCAADVGDFGLLTTVEQQLDDLRIWLKQGMENDLDNAITPNSRNGSTPEFV